MPEKITLQREILSRTRHEVVYLNVLVDYDYTPEVKSYDREQPDEPAEIDIQEITTESGNLVAVTAEEINKIEKELWKKAKQ